MGTFYVYGIYDTRDPDRVRYVGKTTSELKIRLSNHWTYSRKAGRLTRVQGWLKSREGTPEVVAMKVLRTASSDDDLNEAEIATIAEYRARGEADLNHTDGGEGMRGVVRTAESREALSRKYRQTGGPSAKLNWDKVREIREHRMREYEEATSVAERYGVRRTAIDRILKNQLWADSEFDPATIKPRPAGRSKLAKLSMSEVNDIRALRKREWVSSRAISEKYGLTEAAIQHILDNRTYKDPDYSPDDLAQRGPSQFDMPVKGRTHLTPEQVRSIRSRGVGDVKALSREYGITTGHVRNIQLGKTWRSVK